jgi:two-component system, OmpR family, response regulator MprA
MGERVLVVDDDAPVRRMLERSLTAEGYVVEAAADGGGALAAVERAVPDLIVLDVAMPGLDGLAVTERLRGAGITVPILILTARDAVAERVAGLEAGSDDYLVKPFAIAELVARLRALGRRGQDRSGVVTGAGITLDVEERTARRGDLAVGLTAREAALLELLLRTAPRVVSRDAAIAQIWNEAAVPNVVDRYVARLRAKLGEPPVIHTVRGVGFALRP